MFYLVSEVYMQLESIYKPLQDQVTKTTSFDELIKLISPGLIQAFNLGVDWYLAEDFFITGERKKKPAIEFDLKTFLIELSSRYNECNGVRNVRIKSRVNIKIINKNPIEEGTFNDRINNEFVNCVKSVINWAFNKVLNDGRDATSEAFNGN